MGAVPMRRLPSSANDRPAVSWHLGGIASCGSYMSPPSPCDVSHGDRACALAGRKRIHVCNLGCGLLWGNCTTSPVQACILVAVPITQLPPRPVTHLRRCGLETPGCCTGGQARVYADSAVSEARGTHRSGRSVARFSLGWASTELSWCQTVQRSSLDPPSPPPQQGRQASAPLHDNHRLVACARSVGGKRHAAEADERLEEEVKVR